MRHPSRWICSLLIAASSAACAVDNGDATFMTVIEHVDDDGALVSAVLDAEAPVVLEGSMCACADDACREAWVLDNLGCGLCVTMVCTDGGDTHACVACPEQSLVEGPADLAALAL